MTQDEIMLYVDALVAAGCLSVAGGTYPTIALTHAGGEVMRERASIRLALPVPTVSVARADEPSSSASTSSRAAAASTHAKPSTVDETYALYEQGLTIEEIGTQRGITEMTVEKHLADCILEGRPFDVSLHVPAEDRARVAEVATRLGMERLKPLRDALPRHINYRMIRFVVADLQRAAGRAGTSA